MLHAWDTAFFLCQAAPVVLPAQEGVILHLKVSFKLLRIS